MIPRCRWPRTFGPLALAVCLLLSAACTTYDRRVRRLASPDPRTRRKTILWLREYLLDRKPADPEKTQWAQVRLRSLAERDPDPMVRADSLATLAVVADEIDPAIFLDRLDDPHWEVRREAIRGLVLHRDPRAPERILEHLKRSEHFFVRLEALDAVVAYRTEKAYPRLMEILRDVGEEDRLRHGAYRALREITGLSLPFDIYRWTHWYEEYTRSREPAGESPGLPAGEP